MKFLLVALATVALSATLATSDKVRYDNYTLFRFVPKTKAMVQSLIDLESAPLSGYHFFSPIQGEAQPVDVLISPDHQAEFKAILEENNIESEVLVEDIQKSIDNEGFRPDTLAGSFDWRAYHTLDEIYGWLRSIASSYPDRVTLLYGGSTGQGRDILGVRISHNPANAERIVFIEANIHAREWITSAVATFIINQLIGNTDAEVRHLAESYDFYVFPVFNPDGFVHSHTTNRLWRKTRTQYSIFCYGADPNRNWPYQWMTGGASNQPCSDTYGGPAPLSEPSTLSTSNFIRSIGRNLEAYISLHSYSQMLLLPYGHTTAHLDNYDELMLIGRQAIQDLSRRYGTQYVVGNIAETIYVATGGSMDWVKNEFQVPISYTYELRDLGQNGFILPAEEIIPTGLETLDSLVSIFRSYELLHPRTDSE